MASYQSSFLDSEVQGAYGPDNLMGLQIPTGPFYLSDNYPRMNHSSSELELELWEVDYSAHDADSPSLSPVFRPKQGGGQQGKPPQPKVRSSRPLPIAPSVSMYDTQGALSSSSRECTEHYPVVSMGPGSTGTSVSSDDFKSDWVLDSSLVMNKNDTIPKVAFTQCHTRRAQPQTAPALPAGIAHTTQAQGASAPIPLPPSADQTVPKKKLRKHAGRHTKTVKRTGGIVEYTLPPEIAVAPPQAVLPSQVPVCRWVDSQVKQGRPVKVPLPKVEYGQQLEGWDIGPPVEQEQVTGERGEGNAAVETKGATPSAPSSGKTKKTTSSASSGGKRKRARSEVKNGEDDNAGPMGKKRRSNAPRGGTVRGKVAATADHQPEPEPLHN